MKLFVKNKKEFISQVQELKNPILEEMSHCGTLDHYSYAFHIYDRFKGKYSKNNYFYTNHIDKNKWCDKESIDHYFERIKKFKIKINCWYKEAIKN